MKQANKMQRLLLPLLVLVLLTIFPKLSSQELEPTVDIDLSKLSPDAQDRLSTFKVDVQNYLARTRFSDEVIANDTKGKPYKIKCTFQFIFSAATGFDSYDAQLVVSVQRFIWKTDTYTQLFRIKDETWQFNYLRGQSFYHDDLKFNNLTSFLDYYAYLIIGFDDDSWELRLGTDRFRKAQNCVNMAITSGSSNGWSDNNVLKASRNTYPFEMLNSRYDDFRKAFWLYHFAGVDSVKYNKRTALERIAQSIELIAKVKKLEVKSFVIKTFFDTKYNEIAQLMTDHYDRTIYRRLMEVDPDHAATYEESMKK